MMFWLIAMLLIIIHPTIETLIIIVSIGLLIAWGKGVLNIFYSSAKRPPT
jgi:hypothetical protein